MSESRFELGVFHLQYSLSQRTQSETEFVPTITAHWHSRTKYVVLIENSFTVITIKEKSKHTSHAATGWFVLDWILHNLLNSVTAQTSRTHHSKALVLLPECRFSLPFILKGLNDVKLKKKLGRRLERYVRRNHDL